MGAPESNAGDDFHFWWAASRALTLVEPGTELLFLTLEGLARVDDPDEAYETVDVGEYLGGTDVATAYAIILSQLKYSTRNPEAAWTVSRLYSKRTRKRPDGSAAASRSLIGDLAQAYRQFLDDHGQGATAKVKIALVSNQPGDPLLLDSVAAAATWIRAQPGPVTRHALLAALPADYATAVRKLSDATRTILTSAGFCGFLVALDLSQTGALDRPALVRAVRKGTHELTPGRGPDSALRLFELVRQQAMPGPHDGLTADDVLAELGAPELADLYPAPAQLPDVPDPLPAPGAADVAEAALTHPGQLIVARGPAGAGKTTALRQVTSHLPGGSVMVLFDCYGGGSYLNAGEERHTPQRFALQVINELAQRCGTPLLIQPPQQEPDLWRLFSRTLERAADTIDPGAVLVVAVDAADNAAFAASERGDRGFLHGLVRLQLPDRVAVVLTARSHRVPSLDAHSAAMVELAPFDAATSAAHLRRHRPDASGAEAAEFHDRTGGNPRAQFYALDQAAKTGLDMPGLLEKCARTPEPVFEDLLQSALRVSGADAGGQRWLALMLALSRPVSLSTLAAALDVGQAAVTAFAAGLTPGVVVEDGAIRFRDEDFEAYIRDHVKGEDVTAAHGRLADMFLNSRKTDPDAAAHVADHLSAAGRLPELVGLVLAEGSPAGIADGLRREQVQARRLDLAARAAAGTGDAAAAVRLAARGCDTASRTGTLSQLVESRLDLVARYADIDLLRAHALRQDRSQWLGPILMRLAAALSRDPERHAAARAELDRAEAWLRRWTTDRDGETGHWRPPGPDDVAAAMEARFRLDGPAAAVSEFRRWRPLRFARRATAVFASRVAAEFTPAELRDTLTTCGVPLADQAPFLAYAASGSAPDPAWVNEISGALVAKPPGQPQPWHAGMLNAAIRYGDRQVTAVLARHWAREVPAGQWTFSTANSEGTAVVRCHAAAAVFAGADLTAEELVPAQLRPQKAGQGGEPDPREHDRKQWTEIVEPIAAAAVLAVRAATGAAGAADVGTFIDQGLAVRAERAGYRWFTHDPSYRAWAVLAAEAAADAGSPPPVLARLADAAQRLLGYGAPELWLDLAVMLSGRGSHTAIAADLCSRAADGARTGTYPAPDRLDIIARAADTAAAIEPDLGRELFGQAVDVAAGINDDAARLLAVHADLASHASLPVHDRPRVAVRLVRAVEAVAPHVTDPRIIPYTEIAGAAARLHPAAGLAAATRWDDQDRIAMASTLPTALAAAVDAGEVTTWQALALDHLIDDDRDRLGYQLDIADRMRAGGAAGQAAARVALGRAAQRLRLDVAACDQPQLARTLLDAAGKHGLDGQIRAVLDPVCALGEAPGTTRGLPSTRRDGGELQSEMQAMLADPATRGWDRLADDVAALTGASVYGEELRTFIASVVGSAPPGERVDALAAAAALPGEHATTVLSVLADYLRQWRTWPGVTAWAAAELPDLLHRCLPDLAWNQDTGRLLSQLRAFADDRTVRQAILRALPEARPRLTAFGWQNICALLGRLCDSGEAATALLALLDDRLQGDDSEEAAAAGPEGPVPMVLWSAFGHPRRAIRWRAAHAARDLLAHPDPAAAGPLAAALVRCLDHDDPGPFRDPALHFYRLSASTGLLVALQQIAVTDPALLVPHLDELIRHATSRDLPHAQIRELARQAVLAIAAPADPRTETLRSANQPDRCHTYRKPRQAHSDRRISEDRRYRFDQMDTIPYWYAPLARVFDIPVDTVAEFAEGWIIDRWGLSDDVWWTDARELRDQQSWKRTSHRQGSIPPEESLQLYLEYHAMMTAAGQLTDAGRPVQISSWDPSDEWQYWLSAHLPARPWLADLRAPVPADPALFDQSPVPTGTWDLPGPDWYDQALGLKDGQLASDVLVAANTTVHRRVGWEQAYISSAIVHPDHASDLQRALAATPDPTDWKLPDEDESDFEVAHGAFELRGWLTDLPDHRGTLDEHDPYAYGLRRGQPMPGRAFRDRLNAAPGADGFTLVAPDGTILARAEQWADPSTMDDRDTAARSSGSRTRVARDALLRFLTITGSCLIVEVQLGRHRSGTDSGEYQPPRSRIYLIDASGHVTAT